MKKVLFVLISVFFTAGVHGQVKTGIEILRETGFKLLEGKMVGLLTNQTGVDRNLKSTLDILFEASNVNLVALYSPEHGIRGEYPAGEEFESDKDPQTGLPLHSLYGDTKKPTPDMLKGVDVLVFDMQDIGLRSYTYISTMGLAMEAAAENGIEVVILDRPNPLGGNKFEGPLLESGFESLVSQFEITYIHGFTVGELANFLNDEGLLANQVKCDLTVVKMENWDRDMTFASTGLPWVISSPHIPRSDTPYYCALSGILGELYSVNIGVGYTLPFEVFAASWMDAEKLAENMNNLNLEGLIFRPVHFKPFYGDQQGTFLQGIQTYITDYDKVPLTLVQFYVLQECYKLWPDNNPFELCDESRWDMFDKVCGSDKVRKMFTQDFKVESMLAFWNKDEKEFKDRAQKYFLY